MRVSAKCCPMNNNIAEAPRRVPLAARPFPRGGHTATTALAAEHPGSNYKIPLVFCAAAVSVTLLCIIRRNSDSTNGFRLPTGKGSSLQHHHILCNFSIAPLAAAAASLVLAALYPVTLYVAQCCCILWQLKNCCTWTWKIAVLQLLARLLKEDSRMPRVFLLRCVSLLAYCGLSVGLMHALLPPLSCHPATPLFSGVGRGLASAAAPGTPLAAAAAQAESSRRLQCLLLLLGWPVSWDAFFSAAAAAALQSLRFLLLLYSVPLCVSTGSLSFSRVLRVPKAAEAAAPAAANELNEASPSAAATANHDGTVAGVADQIKCLFVAPLLEEVTFRGLMLVLFAAAGFSSTACVAASAALFAIPHCHPALLKALAAVAQHDRCQSRVGICRCMCVAQCEAEAALALRRLLSSLEWPLDTAGSKSVLQTLQHQLLLVLQHHLPQILSTFAFGVVAMCLLLNSRSLLPLVQDQQQPQVLVYSPNVFVTVGLHMVCNWQGPPWRDPLKCSERPDHHPLYAFRRLLLALQLLGFLGAVAEVINM
ncbi:uncharacterized protein LOC34621003 [Cyclospora cayetanensis]|uniref:intramembrane prenyl-peptidase Rce1 n=1 Tax=Cyclospora cayetanensis TaxID=88456 RepID=A0A6P6S0T5_9EIME|nr:uncharacterized protein LOC34621003 [Cyclospora cayetanensis]